MGIEGLQGSLLGIRHQKLIELSKLYRRRIPQDQVSTQEFNRELCAQAFELGRELGALVSRRGRVEQVIVGEARSLPLPEVEDSRGDPSRLRGLRLIHARLTGEGMAEEDLTALGLLRFDAVLAISVDGEGFPGKSWLAHLLPYNAEGQAHEVLPPFAPGRMDVDFQELIRSLEEEFARGRKRRDATREGVILVGTTAPAGKKGEGIDALAELRELCRSAGVEVVGEVSQRRPKPHPRTVLGPGKLRETVVKAMQLGAVTLVFDRELSPSSINAIQKITELKVVDRSQLILDIFAQRAQTREGKIQVELAQLSYNLPRLVGHGVDMSRLTGGIGSRGPGESKLEIDRRRSRERIHRLKKELDDIRRTRSQKRERRRSRSVPVVSIVGYTNAGKSTLLNQLTDSAVPVADKMFATLDPTSRRLRFPREREIVITDTVGFIRELPEELMEAFGATLEELSDADLFLHVVDAADPSWEGQIQAVDRILKELELDRTARILVFNKTDLIDAQQAAERLDRFPDSILVSAINKKSFRPLLTMMEKALFEDAREEVAEEESET